MLFIFRLVVNDSGNRQESLLHLAQRASRTNSHPYVNRNEAITTKSVPTRDALVKISAIGSKTWLT